MITGISAVTLATHDMRRAVEFYRLLDLRLLYGGEEADFTSFAAGDNFLNLVAQPAERALELVGPADLLPFRSRRVCTRTARRCRLAPRFRAAQRHYGASVISISPDTDGARSLPGSCGDRNRSGAK